MKDLWQAVYDTLKGETSVTALTSNIRRVPRRQDLVNGEGIYYRCRTEVNPRVDADNIYLSEVLLHCCAEDEEDAGEMMTALARLFTGHGQAGSYLDFSTEKVHCITSRPMQMDDPAWDTEIQMFVGVFPVEVEWSFN